MRLQSLEKEANTKQNNFIYFNEEWNEKPSTSKGIVWKGLSEETFKLVDKLIRKLDDGKGTSI